MFTDSTNFQARRVQGVKGSRVRKPALNQTTTEFAFRYTPAAAGWNAQLEHISLSFIRRRI
jgi:hypothetical protein